MATRRAPPHPRDPEDHPSADAGDAVAPFVAGNQDYRRLYLETPVMMYATDEQGRVVAVSGLLLSALGYREHELIGRPAVAFLTQASRRYAQKVVWPDLLRTGSCKEAPHRFVRNGGTTIELLLSAEVRRAASGAFAGAMVVLREVKKGATASVAKAPASPTPTAESGYDEQIQNAMVQGEREYREIFECAGVALWAQDFSGVRRYLEDIAPGGAEELRELLELHPEHLVEAASRIHVDDVNNETLRLFGVASKEQLTGSLRRILTAESYSVLREQLIAHSAGRKRYCGETVVQTLTGERRDIILTSVVPPQEPSWDRALISTVDITERKNLEAQLRHGQKMEAVGQLAGGIAHDFNNLLAVIFGRAEIIAKAVRGDSGVMEHVDLILETAAQASQLVSRLLAFSRRQVLQTRIANLNEIVIDTVNMLQRLIGELVTIELRLSDDLGLVHVDSGQIGQLVLNLALNARDAMPRGGRLLIETFNDEDQQGTQSVVLSVRDDGDGMDEETLARIFEPFFTTKEPERGTGLGLATVYGIAEQSRGRIEVQSAPGRGSVFQVFLPRAAAPGPPPLLADGSEATGGPRSPAASLPRACGRPSGQG